MGATASRGALHAVLSALAVAIVMCPLLVAQAYVHAGDEPAAAPARTAALVALTQLQRAVDDAARDLGPAASELRHGRHCITVRDLTAFIRHATALPN